MTSQNTLQRIIMMLTLVTFFIGTQSFVQDDTLTGKNKNTPAAADTLVCCSAMNVTATQEAAETKIVFNNNFNATDAEVYRNFVKETSTIDFSFLKEMEKKAEAELVKNFNNEFKNAAIRFSFGSTASADAESVKNFRADQPKVISYDFRNDFAASDLEIAARFKAEFSPKIVMNMLQGDHLKLTDEAVMQQFSIENNKGVRLAVK